MNFDLMKFDLMIISPFKHNFKFDSKSGRKFNQEYQPKSGRKLNQEYQPKLGL